MSVWEGVKTQTNRVVRAFASRRSALVSISVLGVTAALALGAAPALACPNEQLRQESNMNPATGQPYSAGPAGLPRV